jgi:hypothetical protein
MPLTMNSPTAPSTAQISSSPIGVTLSFVSMKWKENRSANISSDVNTNRILPCAGVRMLPVMFWIHPSVPSSTAPTRACVTKSTNSSSEPTEKLVFTATTSSRTPAVAHAIRLHAPDVKKGFPVKNDRIEPS